MTAECKTEHYATYEGDSHVYSLADPSTQTVIGRLEWDSHFRQFLIRYYENVASPPEALANMAAFLREAAKAENLRD